MSQVQLHVRPRRVRCSTSHEPPPFSFRTAAEVAAAAEARGSRALRVPVRVVALFLAAVGRLIDAAFFLVCITLWCAVHLTLWSYAFEMGPAADCFGLPCPAWVRTKVLLGCAGLVVVTFLAARLLRRLGHRATSMVLLLLVTFDVAALLLLAINAVG